MPLLGKSGKLAKWYAQETMAATPNSSKKRKMGGRAIEAGVDRMLVPGAESDLRFVTRELQDKPEVLAEVARLLRDGELEKAILRKKTAAVQARLGAKLNARTKAFHSLGKKFLRTLVDGWLAPNSIYPADYDGDDIADLDTLRRKVCFALDVLPDTRLPDSHPGAGYEGPLVAVLTERYVRKGRRLDDMRVDTLRSLGWWDRVPDAPGKLHCKILGVTVVVPLTATQVAEGGSWYLEDNEFWNSAKFCSEDGTHNLLVSKLASRQHPALVATQNSMSFEIPEAAASFDDAIGKPSPAAASPAPSVSGASVASALSSSVALGDGPTLPPAEVPCTLAQAAE